MNIQYKEMLEEVMQGYESAPRWQKIREQLNFSTKVDDILTCWFNFPSRKFNYKYLASELVWYLHWNLNTSNISKYAKLWGNISDEYGNAQSNYGYLVFGRELLDGSSQYDWALDSLLNDKDSRQAIVRYNHDMVQIEGIKDFICTLNQQFFIRDNKLIGITNMRSNDLFYWFSYDIVWFSLVQQSLYIDLKHHYPDLELWEMYFNAWSAHVYEPMFDKAFKIISEDWTDIKFELKQSMRYMYETMTRNNSEQRYFDILWQLEDYKGFIEENFNIDIEQNAGK